MSFYPTSAAHRKASVYSPAPPPNPDAGGESILTRIAKLVLPILTGLVAFLILPFPMGLILGSAISVGGLFFGGYLSGDAIKKLFSSIRPPRASLFNEEVNPPLPIQTPSYGSVRMSIGPAPVYTSFLGSRPSYVAPPAFVPVPPPSGFVPPPRYEAKDEHAAPTKEREGVNSGAEGRRSSIPNIPPPPYATAMGQGQFPREREQTSI